jgi:hypothetical protein
LFRPVRARFCARPHRFPADQSRAGQNFAIRKARFFGFNLKHLLNLPRNLAGVLDKNGVQISMLARSTIDRFRRVENSRWRSPRRTSWQDLSRLIFHLSGNKTAPFVVNGGLSFCF